MLVIDHPYKPVEEKSKRKYSVIRGAGKAIHNWFPNHQEPIVYFRLTEDFQIDLLVIVRLADKKSYLVKHSAFCWDYNPYAQIFKMLTKLNDFFKEYDLELPNSRIYLGVSYRAGRPKYKAPEKIFYYLSLEELYKLRKEGKIWTEAFAGKKQIIIPVELFHKKKSEDGSPGYQNFHPQSN